MNLNNIMFIIIFILLILILGFLYYLSTNVKKNQNKINILESDIQALRERLSNEVQRVQSIENNIHKRTMNEQNFNGTNHFTDILKNLSGMNGFEYPQEEESVQEESESSSDSSVQSSEEESVNNGSDEESVQDEESVDEEVSDEESVEEVSDDESVEEVSEIEEVSETKEISEPVPEPVIEEKPVHIDDILPEEPVVTEPTNKKIPSESASKYEIGTVMKGKDGKLYIVSLNKSDKKFWKKK